MANKLKYDKVFIDSFSVNEDVLENLEYNSIQEWDSVGHMGLITALEDTFEITLEMDDIIDFSSYKRGIDILAKHNIAIS